MSWSGGKDAALALEAAARPGAESGPVVGLLTTIDEATGRMPIHGVPVRLLEAQARALGLPLVTVPLPWPCSNEVYLAGLGEALGRHRITRLGFGDLHLSDIRKWREKSLAALGVEAFFPLFGQTGMVEAALEADLDPLVCSVDTTRLDPEFLGRRFDLDFVTELPSGVDPMGENGEFHTVLRGPGWFSDAPVGQVRLDPRHLALAW